MVSDDILRVALAHTIEATNLITLGEKYEGKVRDSYTRDGRRLLVTTDRVSAFDVVLGTVPFKGQVLTALAAFWFRRTLHLAPHHLIRQIDANVLECVDCSPLRLEFVVRGYITGTTSTSLWTHYAAGERSFCGHVIPDGLQKHQRLPAAIVTPTTKASRGEHDRNVSRDEAVSEGLIDATDFDRAARMALAMFEAGQTLCAERGLLLVDTKYELGKNGRGDLLFIDEVHTPDSSRLWLAASYDERVAQGCDPESFDKDVIRLYYAELGYRGDGPPPPLPDDVRLRAARAYITAYEAITGGEFQPDMRPFEERAASLT